ncbi:MAG TPA: molybdopterin molybdotransferase MoeA, partial [Chromatiaceae bacterium]|nr:molybdopterin molybdotransferase MoeA [Chromatiaceae bacterium]
MPNFQIETAPSCADAQEPGVLSVAQARERILRDTAVLSGEERVDLRSALGRTLCRDVISPMNVPGYDNSAMDGYALPGDQLPENAFVDLDVIGTIHAGGRFDARCGPGQCVRIMTGAAMPDGTDTVVMQEQVMVLEGERIRVGSGHRTGQNVRLAGEDIPAGSVVIHTGKTLLPADIGILASVGVSEVSVRRRARVAFFSTGDELRCIGEPLKEGDVYDSNRYTLYGMLKRLDVELLDLGVIGDSEDALREAFESAAGMADIVITSGGVSVGEADYTRIVLEQLGEMNFWKIA